MDKERQDAVIYCRVAAYVRGIDDDELAQQGERCIARANEKGYKVVETFSDVGSGNQGERPGLGAMLAFLKRSGKKDLPVFMDDSSRLARDISVLIRLFAAIREAGGALDVPGLELECAFAASAEAEDVLEEREA